MKALILAGGDLRHTTFVQKCIEESRLVVAADSGLHHATSFNVTPDLMVGDFDSVKAEVLNHYEGVARETYSTHKDLLDIEIALEAARQRGATSFHLLGAIGSRLDQSLAAFFIAARLKREGFEVSLHGAQDVFFLLRETATFDLPAHQLFSVLSLSETSVVTLENADYSLNNFELPFGVGRGVSNRVSASPLKVSVQRGLVTVIVEYES